MRNDSTSRDQPMRTLTKHQLLLMVHHLQYRILLNKRSLRRARCPEKKHGCLYYSFCSFLPFFCLFWGPYSIPSNLGSELPERAGRAFTQAAAFIQHYIQQACDWLTIKKAEKARGRHFANRMHYNCTD